MTDAPVIAIAIPARDEAALIGRCLDAIAAQDGAAPFVTLVLANNCTDATADIARRPRGIDVRVIEHDFSANERSAGHARRMALAQAAGFGTLILTTDADCIPDPDWVCAHRAAFDTGADAVAGRVSGDWAELRNHPADALRVGALEWEYLGLIGEAEAVFDPQPHDPAPRHAQRCGANIGITRAMLARVGGAPPVAVGEDRALLAAVERIDGRVRHDRRPHVVASARTIGRATGGMADALAARQSDDYQCDEQFAPAEQLVARWRARSSARTAWKHGQALVPTATGLIQLDLSAATFGASWDRAAMRLGPVSTLRPDDLPGEIERLRQLVAQHG